MFCFPPPPNYLPAYASSIKPAARVDRGGIAERRERRGASGCFTRFVRAKRLAAGNRGQRAQAYSFVQGLAGLADGTKFLQALDVSN